MLSWTDVQRAPHLEGPLLANEAVEGLPLEVLHHHEVHAVGGLAVVVHGDGVGVLEARNHRRFEGKPLAKLRVAVARVGGVQHLHRDDAPEGRLLGFVDLAHSPLRDQTEDLEAIVDRGPDERVDLRRGGRRVGHGWWSNSSPRALRRLTLDASRGRRRSGLETPLERTSNALWHPALARVNQRGATPGCSSTAGVVTFAAPPIAHTSRLVTWSTHTPHD